MENLQLLHSLQFLLLYSKTLLHVESVTLTSYPVTCEDQCQKGEIMVYCPASSSAAFWILPDWFLVSSRCHRINLSSFFHSSHMILIFSCDVLWSNLTLLPLFDNSCLFLPLADTNFISNCVKLSDGLLCHTNAAGYVLYDECGSYLIEIPLFLSYLAYVASKKWWDKIRCHAAPVAAWYSLENKGVTCLTGNPLFSVQKCWELYNDN